MGKRKQSDDEEEEFAVEEEDDEMDEDFLVPLDEEGDDDDEVSVEEKPGKRGNESDDEEPAAKKQKTSKTTSKSSKKAPPTEKKGKKKEPTAAAGTKKKGAQGKAKVEVIKKESEAKSVILDYLTTQNRPFSVQNVIDNLAGRIKKAMAQKALDSLVSDGAVTLKDQGKTKKIYMVNQSDMQEMDGDELEQLDQEIKDLQEEKKTLLDDIKSLQSEKDKASKSLTNEELAEAIKKEKKLVDEFQGDLDRLSSGIQLATPEQKKAAQEKLDKYISLWKKRKKMAIEIIDAIGESTNDKREKLIELMELDTDEKSQVDINKMGKR